jgi:hypothetical protein
MKQRPSFPRGVYAVLARVSSGYPPLLGRFLRVTHPSATLLVPEGTFSFDLHVLGLPPTFNLSHDQTLQFKYYSLHRVAPPQNNKGASNAKSVVRTFRKTGRSRPAKRPVGHPDSSGAHTNGLIEMLKSGQTGPGPTWQGWRIIRRGPGRARIFGGSFPGDQMPGFLASTQQMIAPEKRVLLRERELHVLHGLGVHADPSARNQTPGCAT